MGSGHRCIACREIVTADGAGLRFGSRFASGPGRTHGGVVVGAVTCLARRASGSADASVAAVSARLHRAVVPERLVRAEVTVDADGLVEVALTDDADLLVTAAVRVVDTVVLRGGLAPTLFGPERRDPLVAPAPGAVPPTAAEPDRFPQCFGCGAAHPSGLQLTARHSSPATAWAPAPRLSGYAEDDGRLDTVMALASLVCPSAATLLRVDAASATGSGSDLADGDILLGSLDAELLGWAPAAGPYAVAAHRWRRDGRKVLADAALLGAGGHAALLATATWILAPDAHTATP